LESASTGWEVDLLDDALSLTIKEVEDVVVVGEY